MPQSAVAPIIPNIGAVEEAIAASGEIIFTATDRKIIEERTGQIDRNRSFREVFKGEELMPEVENEETTVKEGKDIPELENRIKIHESLLKHSTIYNPQEKVEISLEEASAVIPSSPEPKPTINRETAAMLKELNLDPIELVSKFSLEENELHELVYKIKDLHLKRVLSNSKTDFESLSQRIKKHTLSLCKKEARGWLEVKLDKLTLNTAQYKLNLLKSMQALEFDAQQEKNIKWLQEFCGSAE